MSVPLAGGGPAAGSGNAARSILPLGVSGIASRNTIEDGSIVRGIAFSRNRRSPAASCDAPARATT